MPRHLFAAIFIVALAALPATADEPPIGVPAMYETVDAIAVWGRRIIVTGIIVGQTTPSSFQYPILEEGPASDAASRCDRLALLAMNKPGKFQFAVDRPPFQSFFRCTLTTRTP